MDTAEQPGLEEIPVAADTQSQEVDEYKYAPDPELIYNRDSIAPICVSEFWLWFVNRRAFYVQSAYDKPAEYLKGAKQYIRVDAQLNENRIIRHLCGIETIGLYTIDPETNCCKWFCLDADYKDEEKGTDAKVDLRAIEEEMKLDGLSPAYENSRRGGHLWLICDEPLPAKSGRIYLYNLLDRLGYDIRGVRGNAEGVEVFPKQEALDKGQYGNGLRGPLGIHRKVKKRFWFRDAAPVLASQFSYLRTLPRLTRAKLDELNASMTMPDDLIYKPPPPPILTTPVSIFDKFDIRRYTTEPRRKASSKGDYFTRCPACASIGRDTTGDNLHITPVGGVDPPIFYCQACNVSFRDMMEICYRRFGRPESTFRRKFK